MNEVLWGLGHHFKINEKVSVAGPGTFQQTVELPWWAFIVLRDLWATVKAVNQKHEDPCYQTSEKNLSEIQVRLSAFLLLHPGRSNLSSQTTPMSQVVPK